MRRERSYSPIPNARFEQIMKQLKDGEYATIHRRGERPPDEVFAQPIGPQPAPPQNVGHPFLRNLGLVGLGAGLGGVLTYYRKPLMKLGKKVINYPIDKFHQWIHPTNETATPQIGNRQAF